jgi:hypothetical protein
MSEAHDNPAEVSSTSQKALSDYVRECEQFVQNPSTMDNGGDPWSKVAALYVLKHDHKDVFDELLRNKEMVRIGAKIGMAAKDYHLVLQFSDIVSDSSKKGESPAPYTHLEGQVDEIMQSIRGNTFDKNTYHLLEQALKAADEYSITMDKPDARFIGLYARIQNAADYALKSQSAPVLDIVLEPVEITEPIETQEEITYAPQIKPMSFDELEKTLYNLEREITDCKFNPESRRQFADLQLRAKYLAAKDSASERRKQRLDKLREKMIDYMITYDSVLGDISEAAKEGDARAKVAALNALKNENSLELEEALRSKPGILMSLKKQVYANDSAENWAMMKKFQNIVPYSGRKDYETRTIRRHVKKPVSGFRKFLAATATAAAVTIGGMFGLDYLVGINKEEPQKQEEQAGTRKEEPLKQEAQVAIPKQEAPVTMPEAKRFSLFGAANKFVSYFTKAPEAVNDAVTQANDAATQIARAFAEAPSMLPAPTAPAPKAEPVLDFIWDKPSEPEMTLTPLTDTELKYLEDSFEPAVLELDFSKPIKREPSLDFGLQ